MGCVIYKARLLSEGITHTQKQVVHGCLDPHQIRISEGKRDILSGIDMFQGILNDLIFILCKGDPAQFIRF